ncbi:zinc-dependent alcohol dehydrogenase family protein [Nocardioides piscis]|uniref:Probable alcohol dehydrogenase AdhA n=2 Tax=Nocardioides piscis TaxID=2714938 RepID=A0A6G7YKW0_9ACTN|nr:zinc-dependent alcohol dehydrogenase family protein [Nocardioides piscis]
MRAWVVSGKGDERGRVLQVERAVPRPAPDEVLVRVLACGVCRTDLHLADGDLAPRAPARVPGHEVVGEVVATGDASRRFGTGDRVGIAWLRRTCQGCRACRAGRENLCRASQYTGWDADGGFAEYAVVAEAWAYRLPADADPVTTAPLLCSGIIGYRALRRAGLPPGGRLGIYGFGASAHLIAQLAIAQGAEVHVLTRGRPAQKLALELGAAWAGDAHARPPALLDAAILFAPVGELVPVALEALDQGGTLAVAGIHLSDIPGLDYQAHLFRERTLTSVTANTRLDGEEWLRLAATTGVRARVTAYPFTDADRALDDLATGALTGAAVLRGLPDSEVGRP